MAFHDRSPEDQVNSIISEPQHAALDTTRRDQIINAEHPKFNLIAPRASSIQPKSPDKIEPQEAMEGPELWLRATVHPWQVR